MKSRDVYERPAAAFSEMYAKAGEIFGTLHEEVGKVLYREHRKVAKASSFPVLVHGKRKRQDGWTWYYVAVAENRTMASKGIFGLFAFTIIDTDEGSGYPNILVIEGRDESKPYFKFLSSRCMEDYVKTRGIPVDTDEATMTLEFLKEMYFSRMISSVTEKGQGWAYSVTITGSDDDTPLVVDYVEMTSLVGVARGLGDPQDRGFFFMDYDDIDEIYKSRTQEKKEKVIDGILDAWRHAGI